MLGFVDTLLGGVAFGMLLFLLAAGLTLIFGLMDVVNVAHGSFYLLGAYLGAAVVVATGSFLLGLGLATAVMALLGYAVQRGLLQYVPSDHLRQILLTFGLLLVLGDISLIIWEGRTILIAQPELLSGSFSIGDLTLPKYRMSLIGIGFLIAGLFWLIQSRTRLGLMIRAGVDDPGMLQAVGTNIYRLFAIVFAIGAGLAGFAGVMGAAVLGAYPGIDLEIAILAFAVIIIGGLGSMKGAFVGSLLVGIVDTFAAAYVPQLAFIAIFILMVAVLVWRPTGLYGRPV